MQRVLLTGASGFIAWHLARTLLAANIETVGLVRASSDTTQIDGIDVEQHVGELGDFESLKKAVRHCDTVFHLAGLTKALSADELMRVNARGSANLARACAAQPNPPTLVYVSSLAAAGPTKRNNPLIESRPAAPVSNYGRSKLAGEEAIRLTAHDLPITVIRPPIVFGEADPGMLVVFKALRRTRVHVIPGYQRHLFSLIYAGDLARLCIQASDHGQRLLPTFDYGCGIYFAESATRLSYAELGRYIGRSLGCSTIPLPVPNLAVRLAGAIADLAAKSSGVSRYMSADKAREATSGSWICSANKAIKQLGFQLPDCLDDKFQATASWYRAQRWL